MTAKTTTAGRPSGRPAPKRNAAPAAASAPVESVDQAIAIAQQGRVNVTPSKAIELAGTLLRQGKLGQAEKLLTNYFFAGSSTCCFPRRSSSTPCAIRSIRACRASPSCSRTLGLGWNAKCLDFHNSDRPVKTASVAQVRRPIYNTAVKRWMKYGPGLQPLVEAIEGKSGKARDKPKAKAKAEENA